MIAPVSEEIFNRYNAFWETLGDLVQSGMSKEQVSKEMKPEFGDTYWYYNIFSRRVY